MACTTGPPTKRAAQPRTGAGSGSKRAKTHSDLTDWKRHVKTEYPGLLKRTVFVPPAHINKQALESVLLAGTQVLISHSPVANMPRKTDKTGPALQESSVRDDFTQQHFQHCLRALANESLEIMTIVSQLRFQDYLRDLNESSLSANSRLPTTKLSGDFDYLIIHRDYGLLVVEIKTIGDLFESSQSEDDDGRLAEKMKKAIEQLQKGKKVLWQLMSDKKSPPAIRATLVMPNVRRKQIERTLQKNNDLKEELCRCLDVPETDDPVGHCLFADAMSARDTPWYVTEDALDSLRRWWQKVLADPSKRSNPMTEDDYLDLISRFCGPATYAPNDPKKDKSVYMVATGQAASKIGDMFCRYALLKKQFDILTKNIKPRRFICGPPGTGKTVVLILVACKWLREKPGRYLHIASTWSGSLAASHLIFSQVTKFMPEAKGHVLRHEFDLTRSGEVESATATLLAKVVDDELFVICDEAFSGSQFQEFGTELNNNCTKLHLWAANVYGNYSPRCLEREDFTEPLRTPPIITRQVQLSGIIQAGYVPPYSPCSVPLPSDGLPVIWISHGERGHSRDWPGDCETCGEQLGAKLKELCEESLFAANLKNTTTQGSSTASLPLSYSDIFILTTDFDLDDNSGLLQGLRKAMVPFRKVEKGDSVTLAEVAANKGSDKVVVAQANTIRGLERKIVVWVQYEMEGNTDGEREFARLDAMSRSTAQLVMVARNFK